MHRICFSTWEGKVLEIVVILRTEWVLAHAKARKIVVILRSGFVSVHGRAKYW